MPVFNITLFTTTGSPEVIVLLQSLVQTVSTYIEDVNRRQPVGLGSSQSVFVFCFRHAHIPRVP